MMEMDAFRRIAPVRPAAAYIGGKKQLAARIVARIEALAHPDLRGALLGHGRRLSAPPLRTAVRSDQ
jgi:DNA adenine methylase